MKREHEAKVEEALSLIERAQNLINSAAQALCPVDGFADEWSASGKVHDTIKRYWYRVKNRFVCLREEKAK